MADFPMEETPLLGNPQVERPQQPANYWTAKFLLIAALSALGAFAVVSHGASKERASRLEFGIKRIQLAKEGGMKYTMLSDNEKESLFEEFKYNFGKSYVSEEEEKLRFQHFRSFLQKVDTRNEREQNEGGTAIHGVTIFSDYSEEEFSAKYLGYRPSSVAKGASRKEKTLAKVDTYKGSLKAVDWSDVLTTEVKDQGECGSCWAFSVASQMESDAIRKGYLTTSDSLATQQIVSCDSTSEGYDDDIANYGCDGGNTETAYEYVEKVGGLQLAKKYEYISGVTEETESCDVDEDKLVITVSKYYTVDNEDDMIDYVLSTGPLSVCLDASDWSSYVEGIVSSCTSVPNHCVQVVGVDTTNNYWKVRNSWGTDWGDEGYIYLKTGKDMCAISNDPTYTKVSKASSYSTMLPLPPSSTTIKSKVPIVSSSSSHASVEGKKEVKRGSTDIIADMTKKTKQEIKTQQKKELHALAKQKKTAKKETKKAEKTSRKETKKSSKAVPR